MGIILYLIIGGVIGWIASMIMRTNGQQGILLNIGVGVLGSMIGGFIFGPSLGDGLTMMSFLSSLGGAVILLAIVNLIRGRKVR